MTTVWLVTTIASVALVSGYVGYQLAINPAKKLLRDGLEVLDRAEEIRKQGERSLTEAHVLARDSRDLINRARLEGNGVRTVEIDEGKDYGPVEVANMLGVCIASYINHDVTWVEFAHLAGEIYHSVHASLNRGGKAAKQDG